MQNMANPAAAGRPRIDPKHTRYRLKVSASPIHRWGVYAQEFIPRGVKVIEYAGEKINRAETKRRAGRMDVLNYLFTLDAYWTIDGSSGGSGAEFINHSCNPNCRAWIVRGHILYMARRDIRPGEELTVDYRFEPGVERVDCICGSPQCRGTINLPKRNAARKGGRQA